MTLLRRDSKIDWLQVAPLFSGLSRRHLAQVAKHVDAANRKEGEILARQGGLPREFVVLVEGGARVEKDGHVVARLGSGDFFDVPALLERKPKAATVTAETPVSLMVIEARSFDYLLGAVPELQRRLLLALCGRLREADAAWPAPVSAALYQLAPGMGRAAGLPSQP